MLTGVSYVTLQVLPAAQLADAHAGALALQHRPRLSSLTPNEFCVLDQLMLVPACAHMSAVLAACQLKGKQQPCGRAVQICCETRDIVQRAHLAVECPGVIEVHAPVGRIQLRLAASARLPATESIVGTGYRNFCAPEDRLVFSGDPPLAQQLADMHRLEHPCGPPVQK